LTIQDAPIRTYDNDEDDEELSQSMAFKEYKLGRNKKIKPPWPLIITMGLGVAILSLVVYIFAARVLNNPWEYNFIITLAGIPAGFIIAMRNQDLTALTSIRWASYSMLIYVGFFFVFSLIFMNFSPNLLRVLSGIISLLISVGIIAIYSFTTFALGALLGTFANGVRDARS
jgi:hypothetical protein